MKQFALFLVVLFTLSGCKKDEIVTPDYTATFVGTWRATNVTQNGQTINLVGNTDIAMYLKAKAIGTNKLSCMFSTVIQAAVTDSESFEIDISKSGDNYTFTQVGNTGGASYFRYTTATGELKLGGVDDKGTTFEMVLKK
ncbi:hypothetical protein VB776_16290 [Arcicella sp. DC2W]|uniref:Lipocalin-like domain-containing protein n=1 Tax=Arcicella gelida TaxID=2984195 RepID=A0ABU5S8F4_9BACT|nr:hypothetical protein [Arcicella sp. DC2W]MEA5404493.1 hypothetical protein [Arcicella sp. DC2W]